MKVFNEVAKINNVTSEKVRDEITLALTLAYQSSDPNTKATLAKLFPDGNIPTPEQAVIALVRFSRQKMLEGA